MRKIIGGNEKNRAMEKKQASVWCREILTDLKNKKYKPVYFLSGEEPYFIDVISDYIINNTLEPSQQGIDQYVCYGKDITLKSVIENARRFPMMSPKQVIVVKEAQNITKGGEEGGSPFDMLVGYLKNPQPSTVLVFCFKKKADKRKKFVSEVAKSGVFFESEKLYDNQLPSFIHEYINGKGIRMDDNAVQLLADHIGNDLHRLVNELDKLVTTKPSAASSITVDLVEKNVGISKEFNEFELKNAIMQKDVYKSNFIAIHLSQLKSFTLTLTISALYMSFSNLMLYYFLQDKSRANAAAQIGINPFFVKELEEASKKYTPKKTMSIISLLREYDAKSKGFANNAPQSELLKELIYKILH